MISNNRSTVLVTADEVKLPLIIKSGWQFICLDIDDILKRSFGVGYKSCNQLVFSGTCAVWRAYFQDIKYADCQLPYHLRVGI
jgi:hypothetical protein